MTLRWLCGGGVFVMLCLIATRYPVRATQKPEPAGGAGHLDQIKPGQTAAETRTQLGRPDRVARQILYRRYVEQWFYENPPGLWIEFDCLKGQDPRVLTVHAPAAAKP